MTVAANKCPYCNSSDIAIDVNVAIGCHLEDGMIVLNDSYYDNSARQLAENLEGTALDEEKRKYNSLGPIDDVDY